MKAALFVSVFRPPVNRLINHAFSISSPMNSPLSSRTDQYQIAWQDVDANGKMTLRAFSNFLQESAWRHANEVGFGYYYLEQFGAVWVLTAIRAQIDQYPAWNDTIQLTTWHKGHKGLIASRDFEMHNQKGQKIASASTDWIIINFESRRPMRPTIIEAFGNTALNQQALPDTFLSFQMPDSKPEKNHHVVHFSELDMNGHTNNMRYFEWIANAFEPDNTSRLAFHQFEIKFVHECILDDYIEMTITKNSSCFFIQGIRQRDEKQVFEAKAHLAPSGDFLVPPNR